MFKKCKVIMLPSNKEPQKGQILLDEWGGHFTTHSNLKVFKEDSQLIPDGEIRNTIIPQHLYITSENDIIKDTDYRINMWLLRKLLQGDHKIDPIQNYPTTAIQEKVIASTNPNLQIECQGCRFHKNSDNVIYTCSCQKLPSIPEEFIERYCKYKPKEILVKYRAGWYPDSKDSFKDFYKRNYDFYDLEVSDDNTIIIQEVKKTWTKNQVKNLIKQFVQECDQIITWEQHKGCVIDQEKFKEWINKNIQ